MKWTIIIGLAVAFSFFTAHSQDYTRIKTDLEEIRSLDQKLRLQLDSLVRKGGIDWNDPKVKRLLPQMARQDSLNLKYVAGMLDQYGWPGQDKVGVQANEAVFLVIQHAEHEVIRRYFPLLAQSCETGRSPRRFYATMLDRLLVEEKQDQVFGTQISTERKEGKYQPFPIADEADVDKRRSEVGLPPLAPWLQEFNGG